ncbi:cell division protein FtsW [Formicincola oecophyllae]|uniref:Probable peptidoglycan glycosyltransferase FtsW n=1 Tax=Formicincola oecophyllae TaxID=2558361 RepID=A0A4Y6U6M1_9PROT|nr:putative peptidoglycan glycosyltransferase FtsW [Formicincola oecophyllae]QDH13009.1 cell division protein FtsW [Formicincola oecophyllae]
MLPDRNDRSLTGRWWRSLDHFSLGCIFVLLGVGYILVLAATPAVAHRIGASNFMFITKQCAFLVVALLIVLGLSMLSVKRVLVLAFGMGALMLVLTAMTLHSGMDIKGAKRWIALPVMSLQPSEFLKPCFAVVAARLLTMRFAVAPGGGGWFLAGWRRGLAERLYTAVAQRLGHQSLPARLGRQILRPLAAPFPGTLLACGLFGIILMLLQMQPDIGMLSVVTMVFAIQLFIDGLAWWLTGTVVAMMVGAFVLAFTLFPHVHSRVMRFLHPDKGDHYQIDTSLRAFAHGGFWGTGPGEGTVKNFLPDAHADFVFAVAGEEYGLWLCLIIIGLFAVLVIRTLLKLIGVRDPFIILATTGLMAGIGLQAFINMGSTLHLIPTKGMTLPFLSYGGSSAMAIALAFGMMLSLTRKRPQDHSLDDDFGPHDDEAWPINPPLHNELLSLPPRRL